MQRKFREAWLTEIGGDGSFTWWRYADHGTDTIEMMEAGFFDPFQMNASKQSMIRAMLQGSDAVVDALVVQIGASPNHTPVFALLQELKPVLLEDAKKAA